MERVIIITSIFPPTDGVRKFATKKKHSLLVVGDKKIPSNWECLWVRFISLSEQIEWFGHLTELIPLNSDQRQSFGYIKAIQEELKL